MELTAASLDDRLFPTRSANLVGGKVHFKTQMGALS